MGCLRFYLARLLSALLMSVSSAAAQANAWSSSDQATRAVQALLATLDPQQVEAVRFPFDSADCANWSNLPVLMMPPPAKQTSLRKAFIETRDPGKYAMAIFG